MQRYLDVGHGASSAGDSSDPGMLQVLVYSTESRVYGLVVDEILDIVDADMDSGERGASPTVQFSGVIGRRVTDLVNIEEIINMFERDHGLVGV
jgi:two-component system chemotaxis sensor kinase CheA